MSMFQNLVSKATKAVENGKEIVIIANSGIGTGMIFSFVPDDVESNNEIVCIYQGGNVLSINAADIEREDDDGHYLCGNIDVRFDY